MSRALRRLAILDDYQGVALAMGPWHRLPPDLRIEVFRDTLRDEAALAERLAPFDAVLAMRERTPFPATLIARLPHLRLLVTTGRKNRSFDVAAARAQGVTVCGTPDVGTPTVEIAWALILNLLRRVPAEAEALRAGRWQTALGTSVEGLTLGILGLGKLGTRMAAIGRAFGMDVIAWSRSLTDGTAAAAGARRVERETLFAAADVLTLHLPLTAASRGAVGAADIARMKRSAILVNTSRGPLVDRAALAAALREGRLAGAGVDVFDTEPVPPDDPLLACPNLLATPHLGYVTAQNYRAYFEGAVEAVEAFLAGAPIRLLAP